MHRIGRTGRAGKEGYSVTIVTADDLKAVAAIGKLIGEEPKWLGDAPDAETMADGMKRRGRGRGKPVRRGDSKPGRTRGREHTRHAPRGNEGSHAARNGASANGDRTSQPTRSAEGRDTGPLNPSHANGTSHAGRRSSVRRAKCGHRARTACTRAAQPKTTSLRATNAKAAANARVSARP